MNIRKNLKIIIPIVILILVVSATVVYFFAVKKANEASPAPVEVPTVTKPLASVSDEVINSFNYTEEELRKTVIAIAKKRFGDGVFVIPLNADSPSLVEIEGAERYVYMYAADTLNNQENADNIKGLYHVDPVTGEIFDNGNGKMEKIIMESDLNEEE